MKTKETKEDTRSNGRQEKQRKARVTKDDERSKGRKE
jgi:hypothetical protein